MGAGMRYQPQGLVKLAGKSAADRPFLVYLPPFGSISGGGFGGGGVNVVQKFGIGRQFTGGAADSSSQFPGWADGTPYTLLFVGHLTSTGGTQIFISNDNVARVFQFRAETNGAVGFIPFNTGGSPFFPTTANTVTAGKVFVAAARATNTLANVYLNGLDQGGSATLTGTIKGRVTNDNIDIGNRNVSAPLNGAVGLAVIWTRYLSDAELASYMANPWQLFQAPDEEDSLVVASTGSTGTASTTLGGITATAAGAVKGQAASTSTMGGLALAGAGTIKATGTASSTMGGVSLVGAGAAVAAGTASASLAVVSLAGTGTAKAAGTAPATLGSAGLAGAGSAQVVGTATATMAAMSLAAAGGSAFPGVATVTFGGLSLVAGGAVGDAGAAAATLAGISGPGAGAVAARALMAQALAGIGLAVSGTAATSGNGATTWQGMALAGIGITAIPAAEIPPDLAGAGTATLGAVGLFGVGSVRTIGATPGTLGGLILAASGRVATVGAGVVSFGSIQLVAVGGSGVFQRSLARTYIIQPESRLYRITPENRTLKVT